MFIKVTGYGNKKTIVPLQSIELVVESSDECRDTHEKAKSDICIMSSVEGIPVKLTTVETVEKIMLLINESLRIK